MKKTNKLALAASFVSFFALAVGKKLTDKIDKDNEKDRGVDQINK